MNGDLNWETDGLLPEAKAHTEMHKLKTVDRPPAQPLPGIKHDTGKPDWSLLPLDATEKVVEVLTHGAEKYSRDNWKEVPDAENRYFAASMRHVVAFRRGEYLDPESGLPHLAHAICCLMFLLERE